jgi:hypothetical protein
MNQSYPKIKNVDYKTIRNDITQLKDVGTNKGIEMAISFDKGYSPKEVRNFLPKEVSLKWYWVDTYSEEESLRNYRRFFR